MEEHENAAESNGVEESGRDDRLKKLRSLSGLGLVLLGVAIGVLLILLGRNIVSMEKASEETVTQTMAVTTPTSTSTPTPTETMSPTPSPLVPTPTPTPTPTNTPTPTPTPTNTPTPTEKPSPTPTPGMPTAVPTTAPAMRTQGCVVINDYNLLPDMGHLSSSGEFIHVEFYRLNDPYEWETVLPTNGVPGGRYEVLEPLLGHVWEYSSDCSLEEVMAQIRAHIQRRRAGGANNAGFVPWNETGLFKPQE